MTDIGGIMRVRNPLPRAGGLAPQPVEQARLYAPQAFRTQLRAITESDYARMAETHPQVQRAACTRRWTGSWHTMFITVDRRGGLPIDDTFESELVEYLDRFRLAGYDLEIDGPSLVPLDIALDVCPAAGYLASDVEEALLLRFSAVTLPDGMPAFFHPDRFSFAEPVYLSQVIATAMAVPGVAWVKTVRFGRYGGDTTAPIENGVLKMERLEIARLDNDPNRAGERQDRIQDGRRLMHGSTIWNRPGLPGLSYRAGVLRLVLASHAGAPASQGVSGAGRRGPAG